MKKPHLPRLTRDTLLFVGGAALLTWEVVINKDGSEPALLVVLAAMMGLPAVLRLDEKRQRDKVEKP